MEDSAAEEAEGRRAQEDHNRPSGYFMRVGKVLVEVQDFEAVRVNLLLEPIDVFFELVEPRAVQFFIDLLEKQRGEPLFKLQFCPLELKLILFKSLPYIALHSFQFTADNVLVLVGSLTKFSGKFCIVVYDSLLEFLHLHTCLLRKLIVLCNHREVVEGVHVVVDSVF